MASEAAVPAGEPTVSAVPNLASVDSDAGRGLIHAWLRSAFGLDVAETVPLRRRTSRSLDERCTSVHPLDDPMCNGLLIHAVATRLPAASWRRRAPKHLHLLRAPHPEPKTPSQVEANFGAALSVFAAAAEASAAVVPHVEIAALGRALPIVILGERTPVWRLLAWLRVLNPCEDKGRCAPADDDEQRVMQWLHAIQLVRHATESTRDASPFGGDQSGEEESQSNRSRLRLSSLDDIVPAIATGELLCDIAAAISGTPIRGVFRPPRTCATALTNIRRATNRLREAATAASGVPKQEEIGNEAGLLQGDRVAALLWLMAARRTARTRRLGGEGLNPAPVARALRNTTAEVPTCEAGVGGKTCVTATGGVAFVVEPPTTTAAEATAPVEATEAVAAAEAVATADAAVAEAAVAEAAAAEVAVAEAAAAEAVSVEMAASLAFDVFSSTSPLVSAPRAAPAAANDTAPVATHQSVSAMPARHLAPSPLRKATAEWWAESSATTTGAGTGGGAIVSSSGDADDAQLAGLSSWLSSLGLEPRACDLVADAGGLLCAWCDGLPLVRLVETLEGRQIASIERAPRSSAQGLRNIEKALEVLRVRKGLPLTHLYHSHRLSKGEAATIVPLVADLRASWRRVGGGARNRPPVAAPMRAAPGATGKPSASRVGCCTLR